MEPSLQDNWGRRIEYLRLSVTDRCDLRCTYCLPHAFKDYSEPAHWLTFDEIECVVRAFARLGVTRYRITGGEPLLRRDVAGLAARLNHIPGVTDLSLSTNATRLTQHAASLKAAGVTRLNVSLDTLQGERLARIAGRDVLPQILAGLDAAQAAGFAPIKINMVLLPECSLDEVEQMVDFCRERQFVLRLIEPMPMGNSGRSAGQVDMPHIRKHVQARWNLVDGLVPGGGPARYLTSADGSFNIGFITPLSQHFCATCNRVRMTVEGTLYLCLGQEDRVELRPLLRAGISDDDLEQVLRAAIQRKPERHEFREHPHKIVRVMSATGG